jgi:hypothetical protein
MALSKKIASLFTERVGMVDGIRNRLVGSVPSILAPSVALPTARNLHIVFVSEKRSLQKSFNKTVRTLRGIEAYA